MNHIKSIPLSSLNVKTSLLFIICMASLSGCVTVNASEQQAQWIRSASDFAEQNRDALNEATKQTGEVLKKGGNLLGKGLKATGELLQEMTTE